MRYETIFFDQIKLLETIKINPEIYLNGLKMNVTKKN